jgi:hypothetical protein
MLPKLPKWFRSRHGSLSPRVPYFESLALPRDPPFFPAPGTACPTTRAGCVLEVHVHGSNWCKKSVNCPTSNTYRIGSGRQPLCRRLVRLMHKVCATSRCTSTVRRTPTRDHRGRTQGNAGVSRGVAVGCEQGLAFSPIGASLPLCCVDAATLRCRLSPVSASSPASNQVCHHESPWGLSSVLYSEPAFGGIFIVPPVGHATTLRRPTKGCCSSSWMPLPHRRARWPRFA